MDFRAHTRIERAALSLSIVAVSLALTCATLPRARAQSEGRQAQPTQQQTPTPSPSPTETPTPSPTPSPTPDEDVERIESDVTNVLLSATDNKRRFITTLTAEDVRLLEDGVAQQISLFQHETDTPLSIALLVDTSASQEKVMPDEREAAGAFVRSVVRPGKDTASVLSFTGVTRLDQPPTDDAARLLSAIGSLQVRYTAKSPECNRSPTTGEMPDDFHLRCGTAVWDAVVMSIREVLSKTPETTRRAVILLSDGDDYDSRMRDYQAAEFAVRNNAVVYSIGIRDRHFELGSLRKDLLRNISEQTGGRAFFPKNPADLAAAFSQIEQELRSQYLVSYTSANRNGDGAYRKVQIEITNPQLRKQKLRLLYRQGYYAKQMTN